MKDELKLKVNEQLEFCDDLWQRIYGKDIEHPYQLAQDIKRLRRELNEARELLENHWYYEKRDC